MTSRSPSRRVLVVSEERVVAESVAAALVDRGFDVAPGEPHAGSSGRVGLLLVALDTEASLAFARATIEGHGVPWVVVLHSTGEPDGDGIAELGAAVLMCSDASISEIAAVLDRLLGASCPES